MWKKNVSIFSVILDYSISTRFLILICKRTTTSLKTNALKKSKYFQFVTLLCNVLCKKWALPTSKTTLNKKKRNIWNGFFSMLPFRRHLIHLIDIRSKVNVDWIGTFKTNCHSNCTWILEFFISSLKIASKFSFIATVKWFFQSPISPETEEHIYSWVIKLFNNREICLAM